jgi:predicted dehydrogenase
MIGIAVCGLGNWGWNVLRSFAGVPQGQLLYACDLNEALRKKASAAFPRAQAVAELDQALRDPAVQAVALAVDAPAHFRLAQRCLEAGKHVFVEKPLTLRAAEAQELVQLAKARDLRLMVGHLLLYHPAVIYMRQRIDAGEIEPSYLYCQRLNLGVVRQTENAWWSLAPHDVSVACHLLGGEPVSVSATGKAFLQPGVEDVVFATIAFDNGRLAHVHVSWLDPHKVRQVTVVGAKRMMVFDDMQGAEKLRVYDKGVDFKPGVTDYAQAMTLRAGDIHIPSIPAAEPLGLEARHFIECVASGATPLTDGVNGLRVVRVLEAGAASLREAGRPVPIGAG